MALPQAAGALYVGGAIVGAAIVWAVTPEGQRARESLGDTLYDAGAGAVDDITSLFSGEDDEAQTAPVATTTTTTQPCDGPHNGRLQVQGYNARVDPYMIELSWPWNRPCVPPMRGEGHMALSQNLQPRTIAIRRESFLWRGPAFVKMSQFIGNSSPMGYTPADSGGWSITPTGSVVRNRSGGARRDAPRVDMDIFAGRAFGTR